MRTIQVTALLAGLAAADLAVATAAQARLSVRDGVYTATQAEHGKGLYEAKCVSCHGTMTSVLPEMAPLLNDRGFQNQWNARSVGELFTRIRETMPQDQRGTLSPEDTADIVAYILSGNLVPAGDTPLASNVETLNTITLDIQEP
jgi:S-disulfanyl-L-cysteine oxidoreductase SoxD